MVPKMVRLFWYRDERRFDYNFHKVCLIHNVACICSPNREIPNPWERPEIIAELPDFKGEDAGKEVAEILGLLFYK